MALERLRRATLLPLIVALAPLFWVLDATERAALTTLGRDQGIFQYIGWALLKGEVDYRDVRDVNGPLTHLVHVVFLLLGGADEHRFRVLDLTVTGIAFAAVGACLPGIGTASEKAVTWLERLAWAGAAWVVLSGQHLLYLYWDLAQRETFCNWFMLTSVALQLVAQRALMRGEQAGSGTGTGGMRFGALMRSSPLLVVVGALSVIPCFGKPTYAVFTLVQIAAILVDPDLWIGRLRALAVFAIGGAIGAASQLAFLFAYGDARAFFRIYFVDVPAMYRFMLPRSAEEILALQWGGGTAAMAIGTSLLVLGLIWDRQMPRRALAVGLLPVAGLAAVLVQRKGFPYHFHPVTAGMHLAWLVVVAWLWERYRDVGTTPETSSESSGLARFLRFVPFAAGAILSLKVASSLTTSPHITNIWILGKAQSAEERVSHDYLVYFRDHDFFPWEMRQTAEYLRAHTGPTDRVQTYGMDPYVLFLAERLSATPYIYSYDLNADAALGGSWMPNGLRPNGFQTARIKAMREEHVKDFFAKLQKREPAAFVFFDKSPLISEESAWQDFEEQCPEAAKWVAEHYRETVAFGEDHVWLRNDRAGAVAGDVVGH